MWFTDGSRDPLDFRTVATEVRDCSRRMGSKSTDLFFAYWNMTGIPNAQFEDADAAAFQAAAAVYMQDSSSTGRSSSGPIPEPTCITSSSTLPASSDPMVARTRRRAVFASSGKLWLRGSASGSAAEMRTVSLSWPDALRRPTS